MKWKQVRDEILPIISGAFFLLIPVALAMAIFRGNSYSLADEYRRAIRETMSPDPGMVSHALYAFKFDHPINVVTWTQARVVPSLQGPNPKSDPRDIWVTVAPLLKTFCQDYVKSHQPDPQQLALRIKQRLGLPPNATEDTFVELSIDPKTTRLIRPCGDSSVESNTCVPPDLPTPATVWGTTNPSETNKQAEWILRNYYSSFASSAQFPWTSLGYTFDWARKNEESEQFVRWGESEFVIPAGDPVHFVSATDSVSYCASK